MEDNQTPPTQPESNPKPAGPVRTCPHCGQPMVIKSKWEALWRLPTLQEWLVLFMMVMMIFAAWAYKHDVGICQDFIKNSDAFCLQKNGVHITNYSQTINSINLNMYNSSNNSININHTTFGPNESLFGNNSIYVGENVTNSSNLNMSNSNETTP